MTQSDFNTKYGRIAMPMPFAGATGAALASIANTSGSVVNFPDGFPQNYSAPHSKGGKYITRGEMNAIGHLASNESFYKQCGGLNLFNAEFCHNIGGYPKGAVLDYLTGSKLVKVLSLKDNNKVDFTGIGSTNYPDIEKGFIDNVNDWLILNQDFPSPIEDGNLLASLKINTASAIDSVFVGVIKSRKDGYVFINNSNLSRFTGSGTVFRTASNTGSASTFPMIGGSFIAFKNLGPIESSISEITFPDVAHGNMNGWSGIVSPGSRGYTVDHKITISGGLVQYNEIENVSDILSSIRQVNEGDFIAICCVFGTTLTSPTIDFSSTTTQTASVDAIYSCNLFTGTFDIVYV